MKTLIELLAQGAESWNRWRGDDPADTVDLRYLRIWDLPRPIRAGLSEFDLSGADLTGAQLPGADLRNGRLAQVIASRADFEGANLENADLTGARLNEAYLRHVHAKGSSFRGARLVGAHLARANLEDAILRNCDLQRAVIVGCNLNNSDFSEAIFGESVFVDVDLSTVRGLSEIRHIDQSEFDWKTISRSGSVPDWFWRATGIPPHLATYAHSFNQPIQHYSCFISHSSTDALFSRELYIELKQAGISVWYFPEDAKWGQPIWGDIDQSIRIYDKLILVASAAALNSGPVLRELERALTREDREARSVIFPITLDDYLFHGWDHPRRVDVLGKVVGDFRRWRTSQAEYRTALRRLKEGLQRPVTPKA